MMPQPKSLLALALLIPVPTLTVVLAMHWETTAGTRIGEIAYAIGKVWILALPLLWLLLVERGRPSLSLPRQGGLAVGAITGLIIAAVILAAFALVGDRLAEPAMVREFAASVGIDNPARYLALAAYLATINAVLEEYVWRWFVYRQCEKLLPHAGGWIAVALSAAFFTLHHVFVLAAQFGMAIVVLGSVGVFVGGVVWSALYRRYRSIWPGFVSHAIVDVAILAVGWKLIFG
jgi:uncharacterized protein